MSQNDKTPMEANNEEIYKGHPSTSNQQEMVSNSCMPPNELRYINSHPLKLIIGNPFKGIKPRTSFRNISEHSVFVSHIEPRSFPKAENDAN